MNPVQNQLVPWWEQKWSQLMLFKLLMKTQQEVHRHQNIYLKTQLNLLRLFCRCLKTNPVLLFKAFGIFLSPISPHIKATTPHLRLPPTWYWWCSPLTAGVAPGKASWSWRVGVHSAGWGAEGGGRCWRRLWCPGLHPDRGPRCRMWFLEASGSRWSMGGASWVGWGSTRPMEEGRSWWDAAAKSTCEQWVLFLILSKNTELNSWDQKVQSFTFRFLSGVPSSACVTFGLIWGNQCWSISSIFIIMLRKFSLQQESFTVLPLFY